MKLVIDNTNVETIPISNLMDIGGCARRFADDVDAGKHGDVTSVTILIETATGLHRESWGEMPTGYELMGILEAAKLAVFTDDIADCE